MRRVGRLALLAVLLRLTAFDARAQEFVWAKGMGSESSESGSSIAVDSAGNVYTTGSFTGIVDFDPGDPHYKLTSVGGADIFVSKLDGAGSFVWARTVGGTDSDSGASIAVDRAGNVYITGTFNATVDFDPGPGVYNLSSAGSDEAYVSKLDSAGNFVWAKRIGGTSIDLGHGIAVDGVGNVYTVGEFRGTADFDPGPGVYNLVSAGANDIYVSKLDGSGNFVWAKSMRGTYNDVGSAIAVDDAGNVYTTGRFLTHLSATVDFDPGPGVYPLATAGQEDIFVSKLDTAGNFVWAKSMGGASFDQGNSIAVDSAGNVYTIGEFRETADLDPGAGVFNLTAAGLRDIYVSKLDGAGNFVWAKRMGGTTQFGSGNSIAVDGAGNVYSTGGFSDTVDFDPGPGVYDLTSAGSTDMYVSKLDTAGDFVWAERIGSTDWDSGRSIALDVAGNQYTTGGYTFTVDFDPGPGVYNIGNTGYSDIFVSRLRPSTAGGDADGDGVSPAEGDCDDARTTVLPGAVQLCDGVHNDCSDPTWPAVPPNEADTDGDGFRLCQNDCNDGNANVNPGRTEACNGIDDDCDAAVDEGFDVDGDTFTPCAGDCDDTLAAVYPGAFQECDGLNNDCSLPAWPAVPADEANADGDEFRICEGDCDDTRAAVYPGAPQLCDGLNDDCSNPNWPAIPAGEADADLDGYRICQNDCNDAAPSVNPAAAEVCNGVDDDCDGPFDEDDAGIVDGDADGIRNVCDNCPIAPNAFQDDFDGDRVGDTCDNCAQDSNVGQSDWDFDGEGDRCDLNDTLILIFATNKNYREWQNEALYEGWNSYRGDLAVLKATGVYTQAPGSNNLARRDCGLTVPWADDFDPPLPGQAMFHLVAGFANGFEGVLGTNSAGEDRPNANPCP